MVKGMTNALIGGVDNTFSKGEEIWVKNESGSSISKGDKVLIDMGRVRGELAQEYLLLSSGSYCDYGCVFLDDDNALYFFRNAMSLFSFVGYNFEKTDCSFFKVSTSSRLRAHKNGIISMDYLSGSTDSTATTGSIVFMSENRLLPADYKYIGEYRGTHYVQKTYYNNVCSYDFDNNSVIKNIGTTVKGASSYYLDPFSGKGFTSAVSPSSIYFWYIDEDGNFVNEATVATGAVSNDRIVGFTGCDVGDYLIVASNALVKYENNSTVNADVKSNIKFYKVIDNNGIRGVKIVDNVLKQYQEEDCLVFFDNRNDVLSVGTRKGVYAYKFNRTNDDFEEIPLGIELDELSAYCYRLGLSISCDKAIVGKRISKTEVEVCLYDLGSGEAKVVENSSLKYRGDSSFVGFAKEDEDGDNMVKVELLLPEKIDITFESDVELNDDEIVFMGVE